MKSQSEENVTRVSGNHWDDNRVQLGDQPFHLPPLQLALTEGSRNHQKLLPSCQGRHSQHHQVNHNDKKDKNGVKNI